MLVQIKLDDRSVTIDTEKPLSVAIPLDFNGPQPNAYGVPSATSEACAAGELVGDTRRGGSCNFEEYRFIPHCVGTHTECVGHITNDRISVDECLRDAFLPARVVSIAPERFEDCGESYGSTTTPDDLVITRRSLETALSGDGETPALVVRTLPNTDDRLTRRYLDEVPPYFTTEAIEWIVERGVRHLLVDMPSIDRLFDEGRLSNHRKFWNVESGAFETRGGTRLYSTVTELIYVAQNVADGEYVLNLQIPPFKSDAAPSRPILFKIDAI